MLIEELKNGLIPVEGIAKFHTIELFMAAEQTEIRLIEICLSAF